MKSIFPQDMLNTSGSELSLEMIASRLSFFFEQVHLFHLQTPSHAEHTALNVWDDIVNAKDSLLEELMGYKGRKIKAYKFEPIVDYCPGAPEKVVLELKNFAKQLENYASIKGYSNIENMAQDLSGKAVKTLYLLTQS